MATIASLTELVRKLDGDTDYLYANHPDFAEAVDNGDLPSLDIFRDMLAVLKTLEADAAERRERDAFEDAGGFQITPRAA